jgi:ATP-dependent DNA helicase RecG
MNHETLIQYLSALIAKWENEVIEFKLVGTDYKTDKIGEYFSALANEANIRSVECAWLVFGVDNKTRQVQGTDYRSNSEQLQSTKQQIRENTEPSVTFRNIHELNTEQGRVILFEIPAAPRGMPIAWKGHYYARAGESLSHLGLDKQDEIRAQTLQTDWTAQVVADASLADLDEQALAKAKQLFAQKHANRVSAEDVMAWDSMTFLARAKLVQQGKLTRAALLLLGKAESAYLLSPHPAQLTWKLEGQERAYQHFGLPFLLSTSQLYQNIRNIQIRLLPNDQLIPYEVAKYDQKVVLEALHNCIAHQDYLRSARVLVTEYSDKLVFESEGAFYDGQPDDYIFGAKTPRRYRNAQLVQAMVELNMIDSMGYGIHQMNQQQAKRFFPLPDYDLTETGVVKMVIYGAVVDEAYSRVLMQKTDLPFVDIIALDHVQKGRELGEERIKHLRKLKLIEGRKPNFHISAAVASATDQKAAYIRMRAQDDAFYAKLVLDFIEKFGSATRKDINALLLSKLSELLSDKQKTIKINSLITKMRRSGLIENLGSDKQSVWKITK